MFGPPGKVRMAADQILLTERLGNVLHLRLNRPAVLNALNAALRQELAAALGEFSADDGLGALLLTGAGERAFCAGQDLAESRNFSGESALRWIEEFDSLYSAFRALEKPSVAAIQGWATGAGFQLALLGDVRIGSPEARFAMTELDVGIPCITGQFLLEQVVGRARAGELTLTAGRLSAEQALELGVLSRLVPRAELFEQALAVAGELAAMPRVAMAIQKRHLRALSEPAYLATIEAAQRAHRDAFASGEPQRLMAEFVARRK